MLAEVSSNSATEFSWARNVCVDSAGRQSSVRITATMAICSAPNTASLTADSVPQRLTRLKTTTADTASVTARRSHTGQPRANMNSPFSKTVGEYLNRKLEHYPSTGRAIHQPINQPFNLPNHRPTERVMLQPFNLAHHLSTERRPNRPGSAPAIPSAT